MDIDYGPTMCGVRPRHHTFHSADPQTEIVLFSASDDGFPFAGFGRRGQATWIPEPGKAEAGAFCTIRFEDCFATVRDGEPVTIDQAFKRIAFERTAACGDCSRLP